MHGPAAAAAVGINMSLGSIKAPILCYGESGTVEDDALEECCSQCVDTVPQAGFVAITAGYIQQWEWVGRVVEPIGE